MKVVVDKGLLPGWMVTRLKPPHLSGTFFVKATCKLLPDGVAQILDAGDPPGGDLFVDDDELKGLAYALDYVPFKPHCDVLVAGSAHIANGKQATGVIASVALGGFKKEVIVIGDRAWRPGLLGSSAGDPLPFASMPLAWTHAFGGQGYAKNPLGKGIKGDVMPNLEAPGKLVAGKGDRPEPAGLGPIAQAWPQRAAKTGTYDKKWLRERWPWYPEDFDFTFFNAAPADQQLRAFPKGDEAIVLENMHPKLPRLASKLPGKRARIFLRERVLEKRVWREVPVQLDTVWANAEQEKLILVWRGYLDVLSLKLTEIEHLFCVLESVAEAPKSAEFYEKDLDARLEGGAGKEAEADKAEEEAEAAQWKAFDADMKQAKVENEAALAKAEGEIAKHDAAALKKWTAGGHEASQFTQPAPASMMTFAGAEAELAKQLVALDGIDPKLAAEFKAAMPPMTAEQQKETEPPADEDEAEKKWTRESVLDAVKQGFDFRGQDIEDLDLSGAALSGAKFGECSFARVKLSAANFSGADLREAMFQECDLAGADFSGAKLALCDLTGANLAQAKFKGTNLDHATLVSAKLAGADFSECDGPGADFAGAELAAIKAVKANLPAACFDMAKLEAADFSHARLAAARFGGCKAKGAKFNEANLTGLHASKEADFSGAQFKNAQANAGAFDSSRFEGADFAGASLKRAIFTGALLKGAIFTRSDCASAIFDDANAEGASFIQANMLRASFARCDLQRANLGEGNAYEAEFWDAKTAGMEKHNTNLKGSKLA